MAGDWIKMRTNLWDDPRVMKLCDITGAGEAAVIGSLYWLWSAADSHTETGLLPGLTIGAIDRKTGVKGFGAALVEIQWITETTDGIEIARFEEHNGKSSKKRAVTAKRVATHRKPKSNATCVTENGEIGTHGNAGVTLPALAREREDIEKEKNITPLTGSDGAGKPPSPARFVPPTLEQVQAYCTERGNDIDCQHFVDYYTARGWKLGKGSAMKDWQAAVRTWERNGFGRAGPASGQDGGKLAAVDDWLKMREGVNDD